MPERVIGILGGMGPQATVDFYREILTLTPGAQDQDHMQVLIYSNPKIPDRTAAILDGGADPLPHLVESARLLERAGAGIWQFPVTQPITFFRAFNRRSVSRFSI